MEQVLNAVEIVLSIFLMIGVGMLLSGIGWLRDEHSELISRLVVKVALPCMIISNIFTQYTRESLASSVVGIIIPLFSMAITILCGWLCARVFRISKGRRGVFTCMFSFSNAIFIGVPVSQALFGESVTPYTLLYYITNTSLFWTLGYALMRHDSGKPAEKSSFVMIPAYLRAPKSAKMSAEYAPARAALATLSKAVPLPLLTFIACVLLVLLGVTLPKFVMDAAGYVGKLVTPLSLFYTGLLLMRMIRARHVKWQRGYELILIGRFVAAPLLLLASAAAVNHFAGVSGAEAFRAPEIMRNALLIQAAMPVMAQTPIVAAASGSDEEYAAGGIAVSTALSLIFIPLYMYIIEYIL